MNRGSPGRRRCTPCRPCEIFGLDPAGEAARRAIALVAENGRWEHAGQRYFDGEVEPCINGRTIDDRRLLRGRRRRRSSSGSSASGSPTAAGTARPRTGRCAPRSTPRSTCSTGCSSSSARPAGRPRCGEARRGGEEYLLERGLFRRQSTGEVADPAYLEFAFPYYWRYDVLRALDYFRRSGADPDPRMAEAVEVVRSKRQPDGRWLLDRIHPGRVHFDLEGGIGAPSRWNTLRALRVLDWWEPRGAPGEVTPQPMGTRSALPARPRRRGLRDTRGAGASSRTG